MTQSSISQLATDIFGDANLAKTPEQGTTSANTARNKPYVAGEYSRQADAQPSGLAAAADSIFSTPTPATTEEAGFGQQVVDTAQRTAYGMALNAANLFEMEDATAWAAKGVQENQAGADYGLAAIQKAYADDGSRTTSDRYLDTAYELSRLVALGGTEGLTQLTVTGILAAGATGGAVALGASAPVAGGIGLLATTGVAATQGFGEAKANMQQAGLEGDFSQYGAVGAFNTALEMPILRYLKRIPGLQQLPIGKTLNKLDEIIYNPENGLAKQLAKEVAISGATGAATEGLQTYDVAIAINLIQDKEAWYTLTKDQQMELLDAMVKGGVGESTMGVVTSLIQKPNPEKTQTDQDRAEEDALEGMATGRDRVEPTVGEGATTLPTATGKVEPTISEPAPAPVEVNPPAVTGLTPAKAAIAPDPIVTTDGQPTTTTQQQSPTAGVEVGKPEAGISNPVIPVVQPEIKSKLVEIAKVAPNEQAFYDGVLRGQKSVTFEGVSLDQTQLEQIWQQNRTEIQPAADTSMMQAPSGKPTIAPTQAVTTGTMPISDITSQVNPKQTQKTVKVDTLQLGEVKTPEDLVAKLDAITTQLEDEGATDIMFDKGSSGTQSTQSVITSGWKTGPSKPAQEIDNALFKTTMPYNLRGETIEHTDGNLSSYGIKEAFGDEGGTALINMLNTWTKNLAPDLKITLLSHKVSARLGNRLGKETFGQKIPFGEDGVAIILNEKLLSLTEGTLTEDGKIGQKAQDVARAKAIETLAHEFGHAVIGHVMRRSSPEVQRALRNAYMKDLQRAIGLMNSRKELTARMDEFFYAYGGPASIATTWGTEGGSFSNKSITVDYHLNFEEWAAQQMAKYISGKLSTEEAVFWGQKGNKTFLATTIKLLRQLWRRVNKDARINKTFEAYIDGLWLARLLENTHPIDVHSTTSAVGKVLKAFRHSPAGMVRPRRYTDQIEAMRNYDKQGGISSGYLPTDLNYYAVTFGLHGGPRTLVTNPFDTRIKTHSDGKNTHLATFQADAGIRVHDIDQPAPRMPDSGSKNDAYLVKLLNTVGVTSTDSIRTVLKKLGYRTLKDNSSRYMAWLYDNFMIEALADNTLESGTELTIVTDGMWYMGSEQAKPVVEESRRDVGVREVFPETLDNKPAYESAAKILGATPKMIDTMARPIKNVDKFYKRMGDPKFQRAFRFLLTPSQMLQRLSPQPGSSVVPGLASYVQALRDMSAKKYYIMTKTERVVQQWKALSHEEGNNLSRFMFALTRRSDLEKRKLDTNEIEALYQQVFKKPMTKEQWDVFHQIEGAFAESLQGMELAVISRRLQPLGKGVAYNIMNAYKTIAEQHDTPVERISRLITFIEENDIKAVNEAAIKDLKRIAEQFEAMTDRNYFPLSRFGRYVVKVQVQNPETGTWEISQNEGDSSGFYTFDTHVESEAFVRNIKSMGPKYRIVKGKKLDDISSQFVNMPAVFIDTVVDVLYPKDGSGNKLTPAQAEAIEALKLSTGPSAAMMKHLNRRGGIKGYSPDAMRAFAAYQISSAHNIARITHGEEMLLAIKDIRQQSRDIQENAPGLEVDTSAILNVAEFLQDHFKDINAPEGDFPRIRQYMFFIHLGFNIKNMLLNLTQLAMLTGPVFTGRMIAAGVPAGKADFIVTKAMTKAAARAMHKTPPNGKPRGYTDEEDAIYQALLTRGTINQTYARQLAETADPLAPVFRGQRPITQAWDTLVEMSAYGFNLTEEFNRRQAMLCSIDLRSRLSNWNNLTMEQKINLIDEDVRAANGEYSREMRAEVMKGKVKSNIFVFMNYVQHAMNIYTGGEGGHAKWRALTMLFVLGGMMGMPGAEDLTEIINYLVQKYYKNDYKSIKEDIRALSDAWLDNPEALLYGIGGRQNTVLAGLGLLGAPVPEFDLGGSISMGYLVPGSRGMYSADDTPEERVGKAVVSIAGAPAAHAYSVFKAIYDPDMTTAARWQSVVPAAARAVWKTAEMYDSQEVKSQRGKYLGSIAPDDFESRFQYYATLMGMGAGFQSSHITRMQEKYGALYERSVFYRLRLDRLVDDLYRSFPENGGSREDYAKAEKAFREYQDEVSNQPGMEGYVMKSGAIRKALQMRFKNDAMLRAGYPSQKRDLPASEYIDTLYPEDEE